mmetsp:Transcript_2343/g.2283  ORF Transcript_2343/g.2283 Transcript_2343/m.2283 type:complete len:84 (-) Transcript_2343:54-305(-)
METPRVEGDSFENQHSTIGTNDENAQPPDNTTALLSPSPTVHIPSHSSNPLSDGNMNSVLLEYLGGKGYSVDHSKIIRLNGLN